MQARKILPNHRCYSRPRRSNLSVVAPPLLKWLEEARGTRSIRRGDGRIIAGLNEGENASASRGCVPVAARSWRRRHTARRCPPRGAARDSDPADQHGEPGLPYQFTLDELYPALEGHTCGPVFISERVMLQVELERGGKVNRKSESAERSRGQQRRSCPYDRTRAAQLTGILSAAIAPTV